MLRVQCWRSAQLHGCSASDLSPRLRLSLSNGVALHSSWQAACSSALHELIERDRILRSFAGEFAPVRLEAPASELARATSEQFETAAYEIGRSHPARRHRTRMWFMMPQQLNSANDLRLWNIESLADALLRAEREAMQRLAFLWGEELPSEQVEASPTPDFHQEYYLYPPNHARLTEWLAGQIKPRHALQQELPLFDGSPVTYIDLTPAALRGKLAVAKGSIAKRTTATLRRAELSTERSAAPSGLNTRFFG